MSNGISETILVPILVGILEVFKRIGFNSKFIPLLAILLGVILGVVYSGLDIKRGVLVCVFIGLSSVGLYSGVEHTIEGIKGL